MAKSASDNMMTRPQLRSVPAPSYPACVLSWSGGRKSLQWGPGAKFRLSLSVLINFSTVVWHFAGFYRSLECYSLRESKQGEQPPRGGGDRATEAWPD